MADLDFEFDNLEDPAPKQDKVDVSAYVDTPSSKPTGKRRLPLRSDIVVEGRRYKGKRVSRSDIDLDTKALGIFHSDDEDDSADRDADGEEDSDDRDDDDEDDASDDGEDEVDQESRSEQQQAINSVRPEEEEEEKAIAERLASNRKKDQKRAKAVRQQRKVYDAVVDLRIRLEPIMNLARAMPSKEQRKSSMSWAQSEELDTVMTEAEAALSSLNSQLETAWDNSWPSEDMESPDDTQFEQWRDSILNLWGRRVEDASGHVPKGGFKAFDTSVTAQMKASLSTGKHLERTQRIREKIPLIGGGVLDAGLNEAQFDDGELYRVLLREIIESGDAPGGGLRYSKLSKSGKVKKKRHTSYAKGKRLKFEVFDKLVGFLAPVPMPDPGPLDEVLANLFGKAARTEG